MNVFRFFSKVQVKYVYVKSHVSPQRANCYAFTDTSLSRIGGSIETSLSPEIIKLSCNNLIIWLEHVRCLFLSLTPSPKSREHWKVIPRNNHLFSVDKKSQLLEFISCQTSYCPRSAILQNSPSLLPILFSIISQNASIQFQRVSNMEATELKRRKGDGYTHMQRGTGPGSTLHGLWKNQVSDYLSLSSFSAISICFPWRTQPLNGKTRGNFSTRYCRAGAEWRSCLEQ